jgi:hypothetical protein
LESTIRYLARAESKTVQGEVVSIDKPNRDIEVKHGNIPGSDASDDDAI